MRNTHIIMTNSILVHMTNCAEAEKRPKSSAVNPEAGGCFESFRGKMQELDRKAGSSWLNLNQLVTFMELHTWVLHCFTRRVPLNLFFVSPLLYIATLIAITAFQAVPLQSLPQNNILNTSHYVCNAQHCLIVQFNRINASLKCCH